MKKTLFLLLFIGALLVQTSVFAVAKYVGEEAEAENSAKLKTEKYTSFVFGKIKFPKNGKLNYEVFKAAFYGYLNMLESGKISNDNILSICDFTLSSNKKRLWVINLKTKKVLHHSLVAHGMGTGDEYATCFSNINESHQSSLGFYLTSDTYIGNNGYSMKLEGIDGNFNSNAYDRAIVIHGADYVSEKFAKENIRLGRSHGCPALPIETAPIIIDQIKNGSCFFIYHTANNYLSKSRWLNSSISSLPTEANYMHLNDMEVKHNPRYVYTKSDQNADSNTGEVKMKGETKEKVISSIVVINLNSRTGISDTTCIK